MDLTTGKILFAGSATMAKTYSDASATIAVSGLLTATYVKRNLYNANSILIATTATVPTCLTVTASTIVGRKASGGVTDLTASELTDIAKVSGNILINPGIYVPDVVVGTWVRTNIATRAVGNDGFFNSSTNDGDYFQFSYLYLSAGTYTLTAEFITANSFGIVDIYVDGVEKGSQDLYTASTDLTIKTIPSIAVSATGVHTLKMILDGKNGSSSDYVCNCVYISLVRTA